MLDSYAYGSAVTERSLPVSEGRTVADDASDVAALVSAADYRHLVAVTPARAGEPATDSYDAEFAFGLALVLDSLAPDSPR
ncbi:hypothetical protein HHU10_18785 [Tsukamurella columbiensis]|uniref:Tetracycline repressor TetR C-terminal domain-containing protein n=1 Tax=Tsukamurella columbiensis TaxID=128509 RepID=A0ABX1LK70_9ACTN|nr:hypothetical protein [Tsukamurella columbiensis]